MGDGDFLCIHTSRSRYFQPGYLFSCPDFFLLDNASDVYVFLASENPYDNYWTGTYPGE